MTASEIWLGIVATVEVLALVALMVGFLIDMFKK